MLNGSKTFITSGVNADFYTVAARVGAYVFAQWVTHVPGWITSWRAQSMGVACCGHAGVLNLRWCSLRKALQGFHSNDCQSKDGGALTQQVCTCVQPHEPVSPCIIWCVCCFPPLACRFFDDVRVPRGNLIGDWGHGFKGIMCNFNSEVGRGGGHVGVLDMPRWMHLLRVKGSGLRVVCLAAAHSLGGSSAGFGPSVL